MQLGTVEKEETTDGEVLNMPWSGQARTWQAGDYTSTQNNNCIRAENEVITVVLYDRLQDRLVGNRLPNNMFYASL